MRYLAIGDGLCAGHGAPFLSPSFVHRHARLAERNLRERVFVTNVAAANNHANDILQSLSDPNIMRSIKQSDMIVLSAGHQDLQTAKKKYDETGNEEEFIHESRKCRSTIDDIIRGIRDLKEEQEDNYMLIILGLHNPYPNDPLADKWVQRINRYIECRANRRCLKTINLQQHLQDKLDNWCTSDNLYPNHLGHIEIANRLHEIGYDSIRGEQDG
ncbi:hypothetical protein B5V89_10575 [Heyndrickxia sporothermodurans]|uniref:GDSL-type esterase/lipase family protein n=1 Tax=Heyndrickxia TaxID=2837504 RepID=UPI000D3A2473|nr:GDSL-type esterase/lipase family protein [Heyndrickxia sporothermodurans]PTY78439.1 hypothetical protein B5V89_10575 [Heyndrickxia sporothermodurans]